MKACVGNKRKPWNAWITSRKETSVWKDMKSRNVTYHTHFISKFTLAILMWNVYFILPLDFFCHPLLMYIWPGFIKKIENLKLSVL